MRFVQQQPKKSYWNHFLNFDRRTYRKKKIDAELVITSRGEFSEETKMWARIKHGDLETLFGEADYIIPH